MKKLLRALLVLLLLVVLAVGGLLGWLTATEFKPDAVESLEIRSLGADSPAIPASDLQILSWNIGYAGLGKESDFFMDGGKNARSADNATVNRYLNGIRDTLLAEAPDLILLQEVDINSSRTYSIDERGFLDGVAGFRWHFWQGLWYRWIVDREIGRMKRGG